MTDLAREMVEAGGAAMHDAEADEILWDEAPENVKRWCREQSRIGLIAALEKLDQHHGEVLVQDIITQLKESSHGD